MVDGSDLVIQRTLDALTKRAEDAEAAAAAAWDKCEERRLAQEAAEHRADTAEAQYKALQNRATSMSCTNTDLRIALATAEARVKEVEAENEQLRDDAVTRVLALSSDKVIAEAVIEYGSAEKAVEAAHATERTIARAIQDDLQRRLDDARGRGAEVAAKLATAQSALQEALAREAGKDAALRAIQALRTYDLGGPEYGPSYSGYDCDEVREIISQALSTTTPHPWGEVVRAGNRLLDTLRTASEDDVGNGLAQLGWPTLAEAGDFYEAWREYKACAAIIEKEKGDASNL